MKKIALIFCLIFTVSAFAQTPTTSPTPPQTVVDKDDVVVITTNLIQIDVTVTDKKGNIVTDLKPEDFEILENNKKQDITNFSFNETTQPAAPKVEEKSKPNDKNAAPLPPVKLRPEQVKRTFALVVDDLGLSFESVYFVRQALKKFVDTQMQPEDLVAIIRTGSGVGALQQFTSDKRQLYLAIERIKFNSIGRGGISPFAPIQSGAASGVIPADSQSDNGSDDRGELDSAADFNQFRESVFTVGTLGAVNYVIGGMSELPGRKAIMLFSDGFTLFNNNVNGSRQTDDRVLQSLRRLTDAANRASVVVYTMDARGLQTLGLTAADDVSDKTSAQIEQSLSDRRQQNFDTQEGLIYLARETGGISIRNSNDLNGGIKKMLNDQKGYYLLGYQPDDATFDPKIRRYNKLVVKLKRPDLKIRYRSGFFGVTDDETEKRPATNANPRQQLYAALTSPFSSGDVDVRLISLFGNDAKLGSYMRSVIHIKGGDLKFVDDKDGFQKAVFDVVAITFGDNGAVIDEINRTETIRVSKIEALKSINDTGFTYFVNVPIKKPGAYQMRVAFRDTTTNRIGSANQFIEVPNVKKNRLTLSGIALDNYEITASNAEKNDVGSDTDTARRIFKTGTALQFGQIVYNAKLDAATKQPYLQMQFKVFKEGKEIFASKESSVNIEGQTDLQRIVITGGVTLGTSMTAGEYVLQIIVKDTLAKQKRQIATQNIDFEITN
ncbi:MAG: VWA domain-containing protein [Pyrinomonadaceae bacterium]|nr:VWA domain-containing protein [Pyrinomonadaceae bacterium]